MTPMTTHSNQPLGNPVMDSNSPTLTAAWAALATVTDPEIPVLNVIDLGIIAAVTEHERGLTVQVTPTFAACPATAMICENIREAVRAACGAEVTVQIVFDPPWTSQRISEAGRAKLLAFGLAPPRAASTGAGLDHTPCPYCRSANTALESPFGPTLCRSIHYCHDCRQSFEHFKPVGE